MRILYVEDNEANQALVGRVVRAKHHTIVYRDEGEGALELLAGDPEIDLILLDIELAGAISGLDVVKTLRERNDHRPIVAVTAYAMMGDRERILSAGCDQYLPKPLVITDLLILMEHYETGKPLPASAEFEPEVTVPEVSAEAAEAAPEASAAPVAEAAPETPAAVVAEPAPEAPAVSEARPEALAAAETPAAPETPAVQPPSAIVAQPDKPVAISVPVQAGALSVISEVTAPPKSPNGDGSL